MKYPLLYVMLFAISSSAMAGKVYRCPDGSYQDKPCGEGERVVASNNRNAATPAGADKGCFERGKEAARLARLRDTEKITIERLVDSIEQSGKPYQQQLDEKTFAVKVYQTKGSAVEIKTLFESECVAERQKDGVKAAQGVAPASAAPVLPAAPEATKSAEAERDKVCKQLKMKKKSNASAERRGGAADEMEELSDQRKMIDDQIRELCS